MIAIVKYESVDENMDGEMIPYEGVEGVILPRVNENIETFKIRCAEYCHSMNHGDPFSTYYFWDEATEL